MDYDSEYPTKIIANGNIYKINSDYRVALSCFRAIYDEKISNTERGLAIITLLLGEDVPIDDWEECLKKCAIFLRCGKEENDNSEESNMNYLKDKQRVKTSIRQCYHIDVSRLEYLHWWEYNELIEGLTEDTLLSKITEIRSYDLSNEKDENRRRIIQEMKEKVALDKPVRVLTDDEQASVDNFCKLMGIEGR